MKWGPTHFIWLRRNTVFYGENLKSCSRRSIFAKIRKMTVARSGLGSDSPPGCHSLPSPFDSRFQYLLKREGTKGALSFQQMTGIEPALSAWEAEVLPLNHICVSPYIISHPDRFFNMYEKNICQPGRKKSAPGIDPGAVRSSLIIWRWWCT